MRLGYSSLGLAVGVDFTWAYWKSVFAENLTSFKDRPDNYSSFTGFVCIL